MNFLQDISALGCENYIISEVCAPTITTINVDSEHMALISVSALIERLDDTPRAAGVCFTTKGSFRGNSYLHDPYAGDIPVPAKVHLQRFGIGRCKRVTHGNSERLNSSKSKLFQL